MVKDGKKLKLYLNGILDSMTLILGDMFHNKDSLFIGGNPSELCENSLLIDEFRFYNQVLLEQEIQAEASPALGGIEPNYIKLGCIDCTLKKASQSCIDNYHICTAMELHNGGYQIAIIQGWLPKDGKIWSRSALKEIEAE